MHRTEIGILLERLGKKPSRLREIGMTIIGSFVAVSCHIGGWMIPMYFAGRLEASNIEEYETGARYALRLGLADYETALRQMAVVEREHELYFKEIVASHPWLPLLKRFFSWG